MPRRSEDFPEARQRDDLVASLLCLAAAPGAREDYPGMSRNDLSRATGYGKLKIRYSLNRLRARGLVEHVRKGNEGHGYWAVVTKETETDDQ
jgi:hypothetical protein